MIDAELPALCCSSPPAERMITPEDTEDWMAGHDIDADDDIESMIGWLRGVRPPDERAA